MLWLVLLMLFGTLAGTAYDSVPTSSPATADTPGTTNEPKKATQGSGQPLTPLSSVSEFLRSGDARACSAVRGNVEDYVFMAVETRYGSERAIALRSKFYVSVTDVGLSYRDHDTLEMGCSANVQITTPGGTTTVPIEYSLKPSLDSDDDYLISGDWKAAQNVLVNSIALGQFFGGDQATNPNLAHQ